MSVESVRKLLNPTSIAIVGASDSSVWARELYENIVRWDFPGAIHMVNPQRSTAYGRPCYPAVSAIPAKVDHALIVVRASLVPGVLRDCGSAGVRAATVIAAGFSEAGESGNSVAQEVSEICAEHKIELIGPNCYGFLNMPGRAIVSRNWLEESPSQSGRISMTFQSGQLSLSACGSAFQRGIDVRYMVSSGNELVTTSNDYFEYFIEDEGTHVLGGALERIPDPRRFERLALKALDAHKPIVLLKLGTSEVGKQIARSHTGSVTGNAEVVSAFLRDLGVIVVKDIDELMETAGFLAQRGWPRGPRAVFLGGSGGAGEFFADMAEGTDIQLPQIGAATLADVASATGLAASAINNPVDLTATGFGALTEVVPILARSGEFDIIVAQGEEPLSQEVQGSAWVNLLESHMRALGEAAVAGVCPVFLSSADRAPTEFGKRVRQQQGATYLRGKVGVKALHNAIRYGVSRGTLRPRLEQRLREQAGRPAHPDVSSGMSTMSELDAKRVLSDHWIPVSRDICAADVESAIAAAREIGYPVVLKIHSPEISHKSEIGGVVVGIQDDQQLRDAYQGVVSRARRAYPGEDFSSVLVCEQVESGVELIIGAAMDPTIGPVLMIGAGGIYVEVMRDTALAVPPVSEQQAREMLQSLRIWPLLEGTRGRLGVHLPSLVDVIVASSRMIAKLGPRLCELDINPVIATPDCAVAVDALLVLKDGR